MRVALFLVWRLQSGMLKIGDVDIALESTDDDCGLNMKVKKTLKVLKKPKKLETTKPLVRAPWMTQ